MEMTRRQFALSIAAASSMGPSLFGATLSPLGVPRGVVPGRVTWAHDSAAVTWDGTGSWWADANNNQAAIDRMVSHSIRGLTNQKSDAQAWLRPAQSLDLRLFIDGKNDGVVRRVQVPKLKEAHLSPDEPSGDRQPRLAF